MKYQEIVEAVNKIIGEYTAKSKRPVDLLKIRRRHNLVCSGLGRIELTSIIRTEEVMDLEFRNL